MNEKNFLTIGMSLLFLIIVVSFSLIVFSKKDSPFLLKTAEKKMIKYIEKKYDNEKDKFKYEKVTYNNDTCDYSMVITNTDDNKKFVVILKKGELKDNYQK